MSALGKALLGLHAWGGLLFSWVLIPVFITGSLAVFEPEMTHWMQTQTAGPQVSPAKAVALAEERLRTLASDAPIWRIRLPNDRETQIEIGWGSNPRRMETETLETRSGSPVPVRETTGGHFFTHFHADLLLGAPGRWIVGAAGIVMLAALISGLLIHHRVLIDFFTLRPRASRRRAWLDLHNLSGIAALPFLLMITYTGCVILAETFMPAATQVLYEGNHRAIRAEVVKTFERKRSDQPTENLPLSEHLAAAETFFGAGGVSSLVIRNPGDRAGLVQAYRRVDDRLSAVAEHVSFDAVTGALFGRQQDWNPMAFAYRTQVGLHVAHFGGPAIRWLYFFSGLLGALMMTLGTLLLLRKRRQKSGLDLPQRALEALSCASISGILLACAALLASNHLIPAELAGRVTHETRVFFFVWGACALHALWRGERAWHTQCTLAALLCGLVGFGDLWLGGIDDATRRLTDLCLFISGLLLFVSSRRYFSLETQP